MPFYLCVYFTLVTPLLPSLLGAQRSLCPQSTRKSGMLKQAGSSPQMRDDLVSSQKAGTGYC